MSDQAVRVCRAGCNDAPAIALVLQAAFAEYECLYTRAAFAATSSARMRVIKTILDRLVWPLFSSIRL